VLILKLEGMFTKRSVKYLGSLLTVDCKYASRAVPSGDNLEISFVCLITAGCVKTNISQTQDVVPC
jgi:hypothetical protein